MSQSEKRIRIKVLWETGVHTINDIQKILGVSRATIFNVIKRLKNGKNLAHSRGAGRPTVKYNVIKASLVQQIRRSR